MLGLTIMTSKRFREQQLELNRLRADRVKLVGEVHNLNREIYEHIVEGTKAGVDYTTFKPWERRRPVYTSQEKHSL